MFQNATPLRKSVPWPPNISDEHVSCIAPAARNVSLQILVFGNAAKPSRFFCSRLGRCRIPCACHAKRHRNVQKWSEHVMILPCSLPNVLRATTAYTFSTCQLPKVVRAWCALHIMTSKCASRHNGVHFFDMSTSTSGPSMVRFAHFNFDMCFAPQRRALFRPLNFQKCSDAEVFCAFFLRNVLRATTACNCSSLISPHGSAPAFSEPTFRPSGATNHWKNTDFATFSRTCIVFPLTLSLLWSSFLSSLLWLFPPLLFHLSILLEVWLLNFVRTSYNIVFLVALASSCERWPRRTQCLGMPWTGPVHPPAGIRSVLSCASTWRQICVDFVEASSD